MPCCSQLYSIKEMPAAFGAECSLSHWLSSNGTYGWISMDMWHVGFSLNWYHKLMDCSRKIVGLYTCMKVCVVLTQFQETAVVWQQQPQQVHQSISGLRIKHLGELRQEQSFSFKCFPPRIQRREKQRTVSSVWRRDAPWISCGSFWIAKRCKTAGCGSWTRVKT